MILTCWSPEHHGNQSITVKKIRDQSLSIEKLYQEISQKNTKNFTEILMILLNKTRHVE